MANKCEDYLMSSEKEDSLWGLSEDTIKYSLMSTLVLLDDDELTIVLLE